MPWQSSPIMAAAGGKDQDRRHRRLASRFHGFGTHGSERVAAGERTREQLDGGLLAQGDPS